MVTKISIIGAGSAVFSLALIRDICLTPRLAGSEISLMDVNPNRLQAIHRLCERYAAEQRLELTIESTDDRMASLENADFVVNTALIGGHDRMTNGWEVAQRHGYRFGGSLHVMHDEPFWLNFYQLRFFEEVLRDVEKACPNAWYLQVANPVFAGITHLARVFPDIKMVGLCHGFSGVYRLAEALGLDRDGLTFEIPGVNHTVFLTECYHEGQDVFPMIDRWRAEEAESYWESCGTSNSLGPKAFDIYDRFGVFPIGDTCTVGGGSWPWWYHVDEATEARWQEDPAGWWSRYLVRGAEEIEAIEAAANDSSVPVSEVFPPELSGEVMVPLIESIAFDIPRVIISNIPNKGELVPGLPEDFAVEVPTLVSKRGLEGIRTKPLPEPAIGHILRDRIATVTLELDAYVNRSKESLRQLVQMDPWTRTVAQSDEMLDEVLNLPEHGPMREHYQ
jgi:alpha-galactosidase/6-phospho-beta-glucosidase family protein